MNKKKIIIFHTLFYIFLFLTLCIFMSTLWTLQTFGQVKTDQIIFTLFSSMSGTDASVVLSWILEGLLIPVLICLIVAFIQYKMNEKMNKKIRIMAIMTVCLSLIGSALYADHCFGIIQYVTAINQQTDIYTKKKKKKKAEKEEEYIGDESIIYQNSGDAVITGDNTNNLIYIYLESYENAFLDKDNGGLLDDNCLPELTQLAKDNISFSNSEQLGGAYAFSGTTWTIASMVAQTSGLPLKNEVLNNMDQYEKFMPGAITIGDVLHKRGYVQELLIGSNQTFAGTDKLFGQHGGYQIVDYHVLKSQGRIQSGETTDWGTNDACLLRNAKEELNKLSATGKKFNLTMATIDCHMPNGYRCAQCPRTFQDRYQDIYACQSKQVSDFIHWCQQQAWYANTTIVIVGDHPSMASSYTKFISQDYNRTTYNCIINSKISTTNMKNRTFTPMDMFPTTLAAMGFKIKGNKLALGTNLFSPLPTVTEKYGIEYIEQEVQKSSEYLDKNIYQFDQQ